MEIREGFLEVVTFELRSKLYMLKNRQALIRSVVLKFECVSPEGPVKIQLSGHPPESLI